MREDEKIKVCPRCQGVMRPGKAIKTEGQEERVCFVTPTHDGSKILDVLKCRSCGHTVSPDHPLPEITP